MDQTAFFRLSYGVYIITGSAGGKDGGCVINTLSQVTASPAQLSIALNKNNETLKLIQESGSFSGIVLTDDVDMELIKTFGFHSSRDTDKFGKIPYERDTLGNPYPTKDAAARFTCQITDTMDVGTHIIVVGKVIEAEVLKKAEVLTYANYHAKRNGTTPKNSPSYQESKKSGYRCSICGYILEADTLPPDYICPVCGKTGAHFEKI